MARQHRVRDDELNDRDNADPGDMAAGDAPLDQEPPNVAEAQLPPNVAEAQRPSGAAAPPRGDSSPPETAEMQIDVETLQREISQLSDRHLRLAAEFDNYRKRIERERADAWSRAQAELAARILDPLDDLERVTHHAESSSPEALLQGVQLVERKLKAALHTAGLEPVEAEGERFDPNSMEAVAMMPAASHEEDDVVSDVFQRGYRFKGTLIRPARVRVKKHGA